MKKIAIFKKKLYYIAMRKAIQSILNFEYYTDTAEGKAGNRSAFHFHNLYELYYLERGHREYLIDGEPYPVTENTVVLVPPGTFHEATGGEYRRKIFHFSKDYLLRYFSKGYTEELLSAFERRTIILNATEKQDLTLFAARAEQAQLNEDAESFALNVAAVLSLVKSAVSRQRTENKEERLIDRITEYVEHHAFEKLDLQTIADEFFINKYYLCHLFQSKKGISLFDFLTKLRIERASFLLATTDKKVKEISAECGFRSEYYFSKRFRAVMGISPREYQRQSTSKH